MKLLSSSLNNENKNLPEIRFCQTVFQIFQRRLRIRKLNHDVEQLIYSGLGVNLEQKVTQLLSERGQQLQAVVVCHLNIIFAFWCLLRKKNNLGCS